MMMVHSYDWEGARKECMETLNRDPDHIGALEILAQAHWFAGDFAQVIQTTTKLLRLNPLEPGYRYTRGMAHMTIGELGKAAEDFRFALTQSHDPRFLAQVESSLDALNIWMQDLANVSALPSRAVVPMGRPRFAGSPSDILH